MRRVSVLASIMVMLAVVVPARAGGNNGRVSLAAVSPAIPRSAYEASRATNGVLGWVFKLDAGADDSTYSMEIRRGGSGFEELDVYFYEGKAHGQIGDICPVLVQREGPKTETGVICPGPMEAEWGIAVLVAGSDAHFSITY